MKVEQENVGKAWSVSIGNMQLTLVCIASVSAPLLTAKRAWSRGDFVESKKAIERAIDAHNTHLKTVRN